MMAMRLAIKKAVSVKNEIANDFIILAADTVVSQQDLIFGKPTSKNLAIEMLTQLSGKKHQVFTGIAVRHKGKIHSSISETNVYFKKITTEEINYYWDTGECHDKAGGYAIQGKGAMFIERIDGSYSGVVGLPVFECINLLTLLGWKYFSKNSG
jgi:septum formation protein